MNESDILLDIYNRLQQAHVLLDDGDRRALRSLSLTSPQYHALLHLSEAGDVGLTVTELANRLICTRGNATRRAQVLANNGLVQISSDPNDLRLKRVSLTNKGQTILAEAQTAHIGSITRRFDTLTVQERAQLHDLTAKLVDLLERDLAVAVR